MTCRLTIYRQALGWLVLLAPFFFLTYGQVNQFTAGRENIGSLVFDWERHVPFVPLTIIPYWSLDLLYGLSLFVCTSLQEQRRLVGKLVLASLVACLGFLLFPLRFSFSRPALSGLAGWLFSQLEQFDLPYNQSPSLHIILCWLLWRHFRHHLPARWQKLNDGWFLLIAVSVLTTWQHHFIDVISGLVVGMLIDWAIPDEGRWQWHRSTGKRQVLAKRYLAGAVLCLVATLLTPWLWWPTLALLIVALAYGALGVMALQKAASGRLSPAIWWLLLPWRTAMMLTRYYYIRYLPAVSPLGEGVFFGSYPRIPPQQRAVLDLTAEYPRARATHDIAYRCIPMLDLVSPGEVALDQAVTELELLRIQHGSVLVHCALGLSRSALVVTAWLLRYQPQLTLPQAIAQVHNARPQVIFTAEHKELLARWQRKMMT